MYSSALTGVEPNHQTHRIRAVHAVASNDDVRAAALEVEAKAHVVQLAVNHLGVLQSGRGPEVSSGGSCRIAAQHTLHSPAWSVAGALCWFRLHTAGLLPSPGAPRGAHSLCLPGPPRHQWRCLWPH